MLEIRMYFDQGNWIDYQIPEDDMDDVMQAHFTGEIYQVEDSHLSINMSRVVSIRPVEQGEDFDE